MQIKTNRENLLKALSHVQGVVERRNTIPILSNVKIDAADGNVLLTATDMDLTVSENFSAEVAVPGSLTVPAHTFYDIVKKLPDSAEIDLDYESSSLKINSGKCNFTLPVITANDFPVIEAGDITHSFKIARKDLSRLFDKSKFAISTDETRYYLNGIYFHDAIEKGNDVLRAVATDGHRLARVDFPLPEGAKGMPKVIIPRKTIFEIKKVLDEESDNSEVQISLSNVKIKIEFKNSILISKLIDGNFPDYERVIPSGNNKSLKVKVKDITTGIDRVSIISSDKGRAIKFMLEDDVLSLVADNVEVGFAKEEIAVEYNSDKIETGFNSKYLLELTSVLEGESAEMLFADNTAPALVHDASDPGALFVVMPIRI